MKDFVATRIRAALPVVFLAGLVVLISAYDPSFLSLGNLLTLTADSMTLFLLAAGLTFVIMIGGIDLSVQAIASMASCILAAYLGRFGAWAVALAVTGGAVAGLTSSLVSTRLRIPSFIATLAVSGVVLSAGYWFSGTRSINIPSDLSASHLAWATGATLGVPNEIWVGGAALALLSALLHLTPFGRLIRGVGAQEQAVTASGIDVDRIKIAAYTLSGGLAALAGVIMAARLGSGSPTLANESLLPAIAAVIVGGTAITGGVGAIWRSLVGALIVQVVRIGMTFMGVSVFAQQIIFGLILVAAVALTMDRGKLQVIK